MTASKYQIDEAPTQPQEDEALRNLCASIIYRALLDISEETRCSQAERQDAKEYLIEASLRDKEAMSLAWCCQALFDDQWKFHFKLIQKTAEEICSGEKRIYTRKKPSLYTIGLQSSCTLLRSELPLKKCEQ